MTPMFRVFTPTVLALLLCANPARAQQTVATETAPSRTAAAERLLTRRVTLTLTNVPVTRAIDALAPAAKVTVTYSRRVVERVQTPVSLHATAMSLSDAFVHILRGTSLQLVPLPGEQFGVVEVNGTANPPQATGAITGRVTDSATGRGISGANVTVQGQRWSAVTLEDGRFTMPDIPAGAYVVTFKALGHALATRPVTVEAGQRVTVHVVLRQTTHMLSGVVTTATGMRQKLEVGNSSVVLNVDSIMQTAPIMTVTDLIEGRVPGVTVMRTSGTPGDPARIRMRGTSSVNQNNDPIIVVDGIRMYSRQSDDRNINTAEVSVGAGSVTRSYASPAAIDMIDPNSIASMEFLRGPSAASMYGSEAASGVIVITTKRGQPGRMRTDLMVNAGTSDMPSRWPAVNYRFGTSLYGSAPVVCVGYCGDIGIDSTVRFQALNDPRLTALGKGSNYGGSATIKGGVSQMTYNFTASTDNQLGILKLPAIDEERYLRFRGEPAPDWMRRPDRFERRGLLGSVQIPLTPSITLSAETQLSNATQRRTSMSTSVGSAISTLQQTYVDLSQLREKPLLNNPYERVVTDNTNIKNNVVVQVNRWAWLPLTFQVGTDGLTEEVEMSIARGLTVDADSTGVVRGRTKTANTTTARLTTSIPFRRLMNVSAGLDYVQGRTADQDGSFRGIAEGVTDPATGLDMTAATFAKASSENQAFGWYIAPQLNLFSRFHFQPGFRLDKNGLSGGNAGLNALPKMDFSWIALSTDDGDAPLFGVISLLRPRMALGIAGVPPNAGDQLRLFTGGNGNLFDGTATEYGEIFRLGTLGNTRLRPERSTELEGGMDMSLVNGRLGLDLTLYRKRRKDAIIENNYATSVFGGGKTKMNVGDIQNTGVEVNLNTTLIQRHMIGFSVGSSFSRYRSKVVRLSADGAALEFNSAALVSSTRYVEGYPVEGIWSRAIVGYADADSNGWIRSDEVVLGKDAIYVGSTEPKYQIFVSPTLSLFRSRVMVTSSFSYTGGFMQTTTPLTTAAINSPLRTVPGLSPIFGNLIEGPDGFDQQILVLGATNKFSGGTLNRGLFQEVNMLRLQSVTVRFDLGTRGARLLRARNAALSLQGANLGLWTNYVGADPNVNGVLGGRGLQDTGGLPMPRLWQLQLKVGY